MTTIKIRNKNAIIELLKGGKVFEKILLAEGLKPDALTKNILALAGKRKIPVETKPWKMMEKGRSGGTPEVLLGLLAEPSDWKLKDILADISIHNQLPFFLILNRVNYPSNIGFIARTAFAAGVNGLFYQGDKELFLNEETIHFSLGAIARIPLIKMSVFEALNELKSNNVKTYALHMQGETYFKEDLTGPAAFVLGAENEGLSEKICDRCDQKLSIPMQSGIDSLNVGATAAIVLYEKIRQDTLIK